MFELDYSGGEKVNSGLQKRFKLLLDKSELPLLAFLKRGKYYLASSTWGLEQLEEFALSTYDTTDLKGQIPKPPTFLSNLWQESIDLIEKSSEVITKVLIKNQQTGEVNYPAILALFGIPCFLILLMIFKLINSKPEGQVRQQQPIVNQPKKVSETPKQSKKANSKQKKDQ